MPKIMRLPQGLGPACWLWGCGGRLTSHPRDPGAHAQDREAALHGLRRDWRWRGTLDPVKEGLGGQEGFNTLVCPS